MNKIFENVDLDKLTRMLAIKKEFDNGHISLEDAKKRMKEEVGKISPEEYAASEQLLKENNPDECRNENVRTMLDIFDGLIPETQIELPFGHPIDAYKRENIELEILLATGESIWDQEFIKNQWLELMEKIMLYKVHFSRKQNQLYSILEKKGFDRPTTTMWPYDDAIKEEMNSAMQALQNDDLSGFRFAYREMTIDLRDLMAKEELILYPTSLKLISENEFEEMKSGDREIGFFMIDMPEYIQSPKTDKEDKEGFVDELSSLLQKYGLGGKTTSNEVLNVSEGQLTLEQINLLFRHLPVDISYVDENEIVKFYTDTPHRVFPRSKGVIGREVRNCHPPKSVHLVEEIIEKFRTGEKDSTDFWINKPGIFIYIKYVAVRDEHGTFRGVLEMMQDCTRIREVEDSRTLLTWDEEQKEQKKQDQVDPSTSNSQSEISDDVTAKTKLKELLNRYPQLIHDLPKIDEKFKMLNTPIAKVILPKATIQMMSQRADIPLDKLIKKIKGLIDNYKN
ncbi:PAS domain-containing protein [Porphyromonadaceae bacterium W3.11]|nr:PAS domain-containing protein [Porphyromonadaceae bacterium W3.11]